MDIRRHFKHWLVWVLPAVMLLLTLAPIPLFGFYPLLLQIVVSVTALILAYVHFTEKPRFYLAWGIAFVLILVVFNPFFHFTVSMGMVPVPLVAAIVYLANWWFVYRHPVVG